MEQSVIQNEMIQVMRTSSFTHLLLHGATAHEGPGPPRSRVSVITGTPHSVGLLWVSDRPNVETFTPQHTTPTADRLPYQRGDLNPQSQQASGRRPTPYTTRPPGSACNYTVVIHNLIELV